jgi:uncharacterized membrane protein
MYARRISDDGSTVVGEGDLGNTYPWQAFRWSEKTGTQLLGDPVELISSSALGVSTDGTVIVGARQTVAAGLEPYRWTESSGMVGLGAVLDAPMGDGDDGEATATNSDGSVIVGSYPSDQIAPPNPHRAFIWDSHYGLRDLQSVLTELGVEIPDGWILGAAHDISADGRTIVGWALNAQEKFEAFRVTLNAAGDTNIDGKVNVDDLLTVINNWGDCSAPPTVCPGDSSPGPFGDGVVDVDDLLMVINNWT